MKHITMTEMTRMTHMKLSLLTLMVTGVLGAGCVLTSGRALADATFHGTLIEAPPCVINGGNLVVVDFGNRLHSTPIFIGGIPGSFQMSFLSS